MGDPPGAHDPETRVPGLDIGRKILGGIPALRPGEGRDCTLVAALAIATKHDYEWLMGASGAAFTTTIDEDGWDPLAATPRDARTRELAARAAAARLDEVVPPFDDEMRELVLDRIRSSIDAEVPVLVRGAVGPPEYGLLVGYDDAGPTLLARTYFDRGPEPSRVTLDALADTDHGTPIFVDPAPAVDRARAIRDGIAAGLDAAAGSDAALRSWSAALRDAARWSDPKHAGQAAFADHAMRTVLADKRRAAARFMRQIRGELPLRGQGDALRAAESYTRSAELAEKQGAGPFDAAIAMRFVDAGHRRGWANLLDQIARQEVEAREALGAVGAALQ